MLGRDELGVDFAHLFVVDDERAPFASPNDDRGVADGDCRHVLRSDEVERPAPNLEAQSADDRRFHEVDGKALSNDRQARAHGAGWRVPRTCRFALTDQRVCCSVGLDGIRHGGGSEGTWLAGGRRAEEDS